MRLDWYDRALLSFVLEAGLPSEPSLDRTAPIHFGMSAGRIAQRFDAVVDLYTAPPVPLDESDLELLRRASRYRDEAAEAPPR